MKTPRGTARRLRRENMQKFLAEREARQAEMKKGLFQFNGITCSMRTAIELVKGLK